MVGKKKKDVITRLEELLANKDAEIDKLEAKVQAFEQKAEEAEQQGAWRWTKHTKSEEKEGLPVPRLEIRWREESVDGYNWIAAYNFVYRHFLGDVMLVPLGTTKVGGTRSPAFDYATMREGGRVEVPFRDGVHISHDMRTLKLPGYAIYKDLITKLEPLEGKAPYEK